MTYCDEHGLGLAMWHTDATYNDLREMTGSSIFDKPAWTALNNANGENCDGAQNCDGKLVSDKNFSCVYHLPSWVYIFSSDSDSFIHFQLWQQNTGGSKQVFTHISAHRRIKATSDKGCNQFKAGGSGEVGAKGCSGNSAKVVCGGKISWDK